MLQQRELDAQNMDGLLGPLWGYPGVLLSQGVRTVRLPVIARMLTRAIKEPKSVVRAISYQHCRYGPGGRCVSNEKPGA